MPRKCQVSGKRTRVGNSITRRGIAKKKKGIGLNTTGVTKRRFLPNIVRKKRFWFPEENRYVSLRISTSVLRTINKKGISAIIADLRKKGQTV
ncbi:MAG: 50S ribosomal protein L28 [Chlamydiota bacterium]